MTEPVSLKGDAREIALAETQAVRNLVTSDAKRDSLDALAVDVEEGSVDGDAAALLETVFELGLQSGRIRAIYGPGGEQAAVTTLRRLPRGRERSQSARDVTEALHALKGETLHDVKLAAVAPGAFTLELSAGSLDVAIRLDQSGARLASVAT